MNGKGTILNYFKVWCFS